PESERGQRVEHALVRYFARMCGRPTPFGLFAGCAMGALGEGTDLVTEARERYQRRTRLDMGYLARLARSVAADPAVRSDLTFRPNPTLYRAAGRLRYVRSRGHDDDLAYHLVALEDADELRATLRRAEPGASGSSLARALAADGAPPAEADAYIGDLVDSQVLVSEASILLTGSDPAGDLAAQWHSVASAQGAEAGLRSAGEDLAAIDGEGLGTTPERYRTIARRLSEMPVRADAARLFQVDLWKPSPTATLDRSLLDDVLRGVALLQRLAPAAAGGELERFREAFVERYEEREVPLTEALDDEAGIGFPPGGSRGGGSTPADNLPPPALPSPRVEWGKREQFLTHRLTEALSRGATEIHFEARDVDEIANPDPPPLPDAFAVVATFGPSASGVPRVLLRGAYGPSGAMLLGRFCHLDPALRAQVERHLRTEEALDPQAVFAEIVHFPEGRVGNVIARPVLRAHEIPILSRPGVADDRQIPLGDLMVSVVDGRVVLRSARLGRRIVPRLTSAHNYVSRGLSVYRFLCQLQGQGVVASLEWDWGPLWSAAFLPRVIAGGVVLARARWRLVREQLEPLAKLDAEGRFRTVQEWRAKRRWSRFVLLVEGDNELPVDLDNVLSVESFADLVKGREEAILVEFLPGPGELCARGPEGRFVHECVAPFARVRPPDAINPAPAPPALPVAARRRSFPPGTEWLYAKVYTGASSGDRILRDVIVPLTRQVVGAGGADAWFFIRYHDPHGHLRVRLHGEAGALHHHVRPRLEEALATALAEGLAWRVQLDTYEREVERYGGPHGIELAEQIFHADSDAVAVILEALEEGDEGHDERWRLALRGVDALLGDFGLDQAGKRRQAAALRREMGATAKIPGKQGPLLGALFREHGKELVSLLDETRDAESPLLPGIEALTSRSRRIAPVVAHLKGLDRQRVLTVPVSRLIGSFTHMFVNRLVGGHRRETELVLYDFLLRLYDAQIGRASR
ncbi:MAG TPA: lantibiotic dehydratase, partial [Vicinamibacteria bacterium]|nr:lantibiotic dehydratase [Vicinamibacteria bacterium]